MRGERRLCCTSAAAAWLFVAFVGWCVPTLAQPSATLNHYRAAPRPEDGFVLSGADTGPHLGYAAQLHFDYANDPLIYEDRPGQSQSETVSLVRDQLTAHVMFALGLYDFALLYVGLPVNLIMAGDELGNQPTATGFGLGDLRLGGRLHFFRSKGTGVALQIEITAPTGEGGDEGRPGVAGDSGVTFAPLVAAELPAGPFALLFNVGARWREDTRFAGAHFSDVFTFGAGCSLPLWALRASLEVQGESPLSDVGERSGSQLEALLGLKLKAPLGLTFGVAAGAGLLRGYGAPDARGVLMAAFDQQDNEKKPPAKEPTEARTAAPPPPAPKPAPPPPVVAAAPPTPPPPTKPPQPLKPAPQRAVAPPPAPPVIVKPPAKIAPQAAPVAPFPVAPTPAPTPIVVPPPPRAPQAASAAASAQPLALSKPIRFEENSAALNPKSAVTLDEIAQILRDKPAMGIAIEAHVAGDGDVPASTALTQERAAVVRSELAARGVAPSRMKAYGCGEAHPIAPNNVPWGRKKNDRVEVRALDPAPASGINSSGDCSSSK